ncbi:hypothetical protein C8R43DRAFT_955928 [Mycena crocata]|nr:hypothetical protein C8R43DRAFT_955928 [Mycena crocata]
MTDAASWIRLYARVQFKGRTWREEHKTKASSVVAFSVSVSSPFPSFTLLFDRRFHEMFSLLRRFSGSVIPRPDRPWEEDPTSNAPHAGRKRRMADEDRDEDDEEQSRLKKVRGATDEAQPDAQSAARDSSTTPLPQAKESEGVKEVTEGVKEVELEEKLQALPESVPLPEEKAGELDGESSSTASTPPPTGDLAEAQDGAVITETVPAAAEAVSGDVVPEASADSKEIVQSSADVADVVDTSAEAADAPPADARPIKKLRAKTKPAAEPVALNES